LLPAHAEARGLLALLLLTDARRRDEAAAAYRSALALASNPAERRYLERRLAACAVADVRCRASSTRR
jgi:predicted RNA polymerase sigma factor